MLSWLAKRLLDHNLSRLNAGDYRPILRMDADDIRFRFPGDSSWAAELEGKEALARWLQRFVDVGLQIFADEVAVAGFTVAEGRIVEIDLLADRERLAGVDLHVLDG